ncbi:hypothetical protein RBH26_03370 [Natronolimnohabitans sp. A-GB9]|uniref:hypothetical protein n=1 Tax=Natronolimnohabitans sp. A-GB9 TaxID=3069757 RepID=UPI0027B67DD7|nr:hypothetical protein [Natronolimnohabitans sp. A-GB9]MDQ2049516.1 hypothetical protein [Natronolimnohabitans sp. A-GB9]
MILVRTLEREWSDRWQSGTDRSTHRRRSADRSERGRSNARGARPTPFQTDRNDD